MDMSIYLQKAVDWIVLNGFQIALILFLVLLALKATKTISNRIVTVTMPIKQWRVGREFNLRLKKRFDELNIKII